MSLGSPEKQTKRDPTWYKFKFESKGRESGADSVKFPPKGRQLETWEELTFQIKSEDKKKPTSQLEGYQAGGMSLLVSLFVLFWPSPTGEDQPLHQPTELNAKLIQKDPQRHNQNHIWPNV